MMASPTAPLSPGPVGPPDTAPVKRLTLLVVDSQLPVVEPGSCYNKEINTKLGTYISTRVVKKPENLKNDFLCVLDP